MIVCSFLFFVFINWARALTFENFCVQGSVEKYLSIGSNPVSQGSNPHFRRAPKLSGVCVCVCVCVRACFILCSKVLRSRERKRGWDGVV